MGKNRGLDWVAAGALLVAAGAVVAAVNWYSTWSFFARLDVQRGGGAGAISVESQQTFMQWVVVALGALVCAAALALLPRLWSAHRSAGVPEPRTAVAPDA
jgi:hypothetical protein